METTISLKTADSKDFEYLIELGKTYYPPDHPSLTEKFSSWFYLNNPDGNATFVVASEGEFWIGIMVLIPITLEHSSGQLQKACYAVNVLTHPEHRTKNLFIKMIRHSKEFLQEKNIWLLGHPNKNAIPGWKRQKMQFRDPLNLYINKLWSFQIGVRKNRIKTLDQLNKIPSDFWVQLKVRQDAHVKYSPDFIAWRYLDTPHKHYRIFTVYKKNKLIGLYVTRHFKAGVDLMVDFITTTDSNYSILFSNIYKPTLFMFSDNMAHSSILKTCLKLPVKRQFPFFVSTWIKDDGFDMSGITLAASDF